MEPITKTLADVLCVGKKMIHFCTHFDSGYFAHGMALIESMQRHCKPYRLTILALDGECEHILIATKLPPQVAVWPRSDFEDKLGYNLRAQRRQHTWKEYCWLLEPVLCAQMLNRSIESFCYIDADSFFFAPPKPVFDKIPDDALVALSPHRFPLKFSEREQAVGRFNFGFGWFRNTLDVRLLVGRWVDQTLIRCEGNTAGHQRYLDGWPAALKGRLHELPATINAAPWQQTKIAGEPPAIDGEPLVHFHFHEFRKREHGGRNPIEIKKERWNLTDYEVDKSTRQFVYDPYLKELAKHV